MTVIAPAHPTEGHPTAGIAAISHKDTQVKVLTLTIPAAIQAQAAGRYAVFRVAISPSIVINAHVVYGYTGGTQDPDARARNEELCMAASQQIQALQDIPTTLLGDFNQDAALAPTLQELLARGWMDAGITAPWTSKLAEPTCRTHTHTHTHHEDPHSH